MCVLLLSVIMNEGKELRLIEFVLFGGNLITGGEKKNQAMPVGEQRRGETRSQEQRDFP